MNDQPYLPRKAAAACAPPNGTGRGTAAQAPLIPLCRQQRREQGRSRRSVVAAAAPPPGETPDWYRCGAACYAPPPPPFLLLLSTQIKTFQNVVLLSIELHRIASLPLDRDLEESATRTRRRRGCWLGRGATQMWCSSACGQARGTQN